MRRPLARSSALVLCAALAATCAAPHRPEAPAPAPGRAPDVHVAAVGEAGATASPAATTEAPPGEAASAASKPGAVACGAATCNANTQVCCIDTTSQAGRCVPAPEQADTNPCAQAESPWRCDENADCGDGRTCCESYACTDGCPLERVCEKGLCSATNTEVCVKGAACRAGSSCVVDASGRSGSCRLDPHVTPCGNTPCTAGTACCWNKQKKTASCEKECPDVEDVVALHCVSPDQCGGYACADFFMPGRPGGTSMGCMAASFAGDRASAILCRAVADCPRHLGDVAIACRESFPDLPRGVKQCVYP